MLWILYLAATAHLNIQDMGDPPTTDTKLCACFIQQHCYKISSAEIGWQKYLKFSFQISNVCEFEEPSTCVAEILEGGCQKVKIIRVGCKKEKKMLWAGRGAGGGEGGATTIVL